MAVVGTLRLSKHEAAGNDFLVLVDLQGRRALSGAEASALCDRHRGIGADGLLRAVRSHGGGDIGMELRNADGGVAEMSGNGIGCLVQAVVDAGVVEAGVVRVDTPAGERRVEFVAGPTPGTGSVRVEMGAPRLGAEIPVDDLPGVHRGRAVAMGNPHLVLFGPPVGDAEVRSIGPRLAASSATGSNVEFVWGGPGPDELFMRVWERGVGETLACGTGTCAAVAALHDWGIVGRHVRVHNPGGTLDVELGSEGALLAGSTRRIGNVEVDEEMLAHLVLTDRSGTAAPTPAHEVAITQ